MSDELMRKYATPLERHQGRCELCRHGRACETAHRLKTPTAQRKLDAAADRLTDRADRGGYDEDPIL